MHFYISSVKYWQSLSYLIRISDNLKQAKSNVHGTKYTPQVALWEYEQRRNTKCLFGILIILCYISLHSHAIVTVHCSRNVSMLNSKCFCLHVCNVFTWTYGLTRPRSFPQTNFDSSCLSLRPSHVAPFNIPGGNSTRHYTWCLHVCNTSLLLENNSCKLDCLEEKNLFLFNDLSSRFRKFQKSTNYYWL